MKLSNKNKQNIQNVRSILKNDVIIPTSNGKNLSDDSITNTLRKIMAEFKKFELPIIMSEKYPPRFIFQPYREMFILFLDDSNQSNIHKMISYRIKIAEYGCSEMLSNTPLTLSNNVTGYLKYLISQKNMKTYLNKSIVSLFSILPVMARTSLSFDQKKIMLPFGLDMFSGTVKTEYNKTFETIGFHQFRKEVSKISEPMIHPSLRPEGNDTTMEFDKVISMNINGFIESKNMDKDTEILNMRINHFLQRYDVYLKNEGKQIMFPTFEEENDTSINENIIKSYQEYIGMLSNSNAAIIMGNKAIPKKFAKMYEKNEVLFLLENFGGFP